MFLEMYSAKESPLQTSFTVTAGVPITETEVSSDQPDLFTRHKAAPSAVELLLATIFALVPRVIGALWLPNAFGDAYAYTEQIYHMRRALLTGTFGWSNLFGFWLPAYQFVCALISSVVGSPFYTPKVVAAITGACVCLMVLRLTFELTRDKLISFGIFLIVAVNPYHVLYSASAMTDVPHALAILLCGYGCIKNRWILASCCGFVACLMRVESWLLVFSIPLLQVIRERRLSFISCLVLVLAPLLWLYISWVGGGSPWRYFQIRNDYIVQTLASTPHLQSFTIKRIGFDALRMIYACNPLVVVAAASVFLSCRRAKRGKGLSSRRAGCRVSALDILLGCFFGNLIFLILAYATNNQPEIWPRYGLILLVLGLPILGQVISKTRATNRWRTQSVTAVVIVMFALQFSVQLIDVTRITLQDDQHQLAAELLKDQHETDAEVRIYCEDGAIRVLSGIPLEQFADQYNSPTDAGSFLKSLSERRVRFLVYKDLPGSNLEERIRQLAAGRSGVSLEKIALKPKRRREDQIVIYRVHTDEVAEETRQVRRKTQ
jgi:hypothetical protein